MLCKSNILHCPLPLRLLFAFDSEPWHRVLGMVIGREKGVSFIEFYPTKLRGPGCHLNIIFSLLFQIVSNRHENWYHSSFHDLVVFFDTYHKGVCRHLRITLGPSSLWVPERWVVGWMSLLPGLCHQGNASSSVTNQLKRDLHTQGTIAH